MIFSSIALEICLTIVSGAHTNDEVTVLLQVVYKNVQMYKLCISYDVSPYIQFDQLHLFDVEMNFYVTIYMHIDDMIENFHWKLIIWMQIYLFISILTMIRKPCIFHYKCKFIGYFAFLIQKC